MKKQDTLEKILIPVIITGFLFIVSLYIGINMIVGSYIDDQTKMFFAFYMTLLLITLVIIAIFVTNRFVKKPMIELTDFLDKIENDQYESFKKNFDNTDIDNFVVQVNKLIKYLDNKDKKTNNLIENLKDSNKSLEEYQKAVDASAMILKFDVDGKITYANDKLLKNTSYKKDELVNKNYNILKHKDMDEQFFISLWDTIKQKNIWNGEVKNIDKNNNIFYTSTIIVPILDSNEEIIEYLSFSIDITKQIESLKKAKEAEASKSIFLANMSHEIRTPLNGILGFAKLLESSQLPKKEKGYINIINSSAKSLLGIINDILDISKIESGKIELEKRRFNPFKEFEPAIELFVAKANEKSIDILFYIDPSLPSSIIGDSLKVKQVLSNLIGNAIKFTPEHGDITIRIEETEKTDKKVKILFSIKDSGIGIAKENQKLIFDPFSQADSSVTRKFGGTGLGLSISSNIISLMGSEIHLDSQEDKGSEFYFELELDYEKSKNLYPQIDTSSKIAIYCEEYDCTSQLGIAKKYLANYSNPEVTNTVKGLNDYSLIIGWYEELTSLNLDKIDIPLIFISDYKDKNLEISNEHRIIKSPINQSKLYDAIVDILNPDLKEDVQIDTQLIENSNILALVVEDNPVNQHLMEAMLSQKKIKSKSADNGQIAVDKIKSGLVFDIIFMDINMPVMNGIDATHEILKFEQENNLEHTPIIALTANALSGDKEKFLKEGMDGYIPKPFEEYMLDDVLNNFLNLKKKEESKDSNKIIEVDVDEFDIDIENFEYSIEESANNLKLKLPIFKTILKTFITSINLDLEKLDEAIEKNDYKEIQSIAHKIKGASGNLKMDTIFKLTKDIEYLAKDKTDIDYKQKYEQLVLLIDKIKEVYEKS
ncbi:ATP-binding protein [Halarcobacter sp.]|uniref:PAS domain-containing hybrid sensor histidine kinase/response regulator n=1 Tax=Halarcobacter sp. TaxID=2321133 RepID=UPI0029F59FAE|nr:ATP-binding protein [Halarcobacter sp.]